MERLDQMKAALGIKGEDKDALLELALRVVEDQVLSYINHETLPKALEGVLVFMATEYWKGAGFGTDQAAPGPVSSVSRGDVSTSFATATGAEATAGTFGLGGGDGFFGWRTVLNAYRRVKW